MNRKPSLIPAIVTGSLMLAAGIGCFIASAFVDVTDTVYTLYAFGGIAGVAGIILLLFALMMKRQRAIQDANFANKDSIANKVMGEGSKFTHFVIIPDAKKQGMTNVAANVAGIASAALLGAGVLQWGKKMLDAFVSDDELIINIEDSAKFNDSNFACYASEEIEKIEFESVRGAERITIYLTAQRLLCFDIKTDNYPAEYIREKFSKLCPVGEQKAGVFEGLE